MKRIIITIFGVLTAFVVTVGFFAGASLNPAPVVVQGHAATLIPYFTVQPTKMPTAATTPQEQNTQIPTDLASYPCAHEQVKVSVADHEWVCLKHSPPYSLREIEQTYHANFGTYDNPSWDPSDNCSNPIAGCLAANQGSWNVVHIGNGYFHDFAGFYKIYPLDGCANTIDCQIYWPIQLKP